MLCRIVTSSRQLLLKTCASWQLLRKCCSVFTRGLALGCMVRERGLLRKMHFMRARCPMIVVSVPRVGRTVGALSVQRLRFDQASLLRGGPHLIV
jgi:hypothetical protein